MSWLDASQNNIIKSEEIASVMDSPYDDDDDGWPGVKLLYAHTKRTLSLEWTKNENYYEMFGRPHAVQPDS